MRGHLGTLLLEEGIVTEEVLKAGLDIHHESGRPLGRVLVEENLVEERDLVRVLAKNIGIDFVDLDDETVDPAASALIPEALARRYAALPIGFDEDKLVVAMADPANVLAIDDIRAISGREVVLKVATRSDVEAAVSRMASLDNSVTDMAELAAEDAVESHDLGAVEAAAEEAPVVKLVNMLITRASADRASDIHIEPTERDLRVRFRIDGVLHEIMRTPRSIAKRRGQPSEDHGRHRHRRATPAPGRANQPQGRRQATRPARVQPAHHLRREGRYAAPRHEHGAAGTEGPGVPRAKTSAATRSRSPSRTARSCASGRPVRARSTTLYATLNMLNRPEVQHRHDRGPGGVPLVRHQPGPGEQEGRPHLRVGAAVLPPPGPGHHAGR